jgi:PEP-CTERM motif
LRQATTLIDGLLLSGSLQHAGVGSIAPSVTQNVVVEGDIFNAADNSSLRMTIGLRSNAGGGQNLVELGFHNHSTFNAFAHRLVLWGDDDVATVPNWADFALPAAFDTNSNGTNLFEIGPAWHRFRAVIGVDRVRLELDLYRNGMSMTLDGNGHPVAVPGPDSVVEYSITPTAAGFNSLRIGSPSGVVSTGGVAFDNLYLALVDVPTPGLPGDYNYDNRVDAADYVVWRKSLGTNILAGDGDGDGDVDANDYNVWRANFGKATLSAAAQAVVPEPTTAAMAMLALLGLACRRHRARNQC